MASHDVTDLNLRLLNDLRNWLFMRKSQHLCQSILVRSPSSLSDFLLPAVKPWAVDQLRSNVIPPPPPFDKGQTYTVILNLGSNYVDVGQYQFSKDTVSKEKLQQGWTRWITNADREGKANSWTELNIKTGELKDIGINGQVELQSLCSQVK